MFLSGVLSGRGLCDELITRPEESLPTVVRRCVWSRNLVNEEALAHWGAVVPKNKKTSVLCVKHQVQRISELMTVWRNNTALCSWIFGLFNDVSFYAFVIRITKGRKKSLFYC
jgi:hypothetical protein